MNLFEILKKREIDPTAEFRRLVELFNEDAIPLTHFGLHSFKEWIDKRFRSLPIRSSFLSVDDMLKELGINEKTEYFVDFNQLFLYCEILSNLINQVLEKIERESKVEGQAAAIIDNINEILEKTNHEMKKIEDGFVVVDKNPATTEAIECLGDDKANLALSMIEYNRVLLKGNLQRKREILVALADYTEPMNNDFKGTQYAALYSDSRFLVNAIDIRHNNSGKGDLPEKAKSWTSQEKEAWYDKTYQVLLTVILARKHIDVSKEIQDLKPARN